MTMTLAQIEKEVFQLPSDEQQKLASDICNRQHVTPEELEDLRIVRARIREIDEGHVNLVDHESAMQTLHNRFKQRQKH
ncbi:MAG: hypothetical protein PHV82_18390 [Victivallaceae bacterium]|nr:hypothetical protein [Victivallaceae bacterium]